jgi:hypothetical protein
MYIAGKNKIYLLLVWNRLEKFSFLHASKDGVIFFFFFSDNIHIVFALVKWINGHDNTLIKDNQTSCFNIFHQW